METVNTQQPENIEDESFDAIVEAIRFGNINSEEELFDAIVEAIRFGN